MRDFQKSSKRPLVLVNESFLLLLLSILLVFFPYGIFMEGGFKSSKREMTNDREREKRGTRWILLCHLTTVVNHLNVLVKSSDVLLLSKAWRYLIRPESVRLQGQLLDLDERVGEIAILHQQRALTNPYVQRAGQFSVVAVFSLRLLECFCFHKKKREEKKNLMDHSSLSSYLFFPPVNLLLFFFTCHWKKVLAKNFKEFFQFTTRSQVCTFYIQSSATWIEEEKKRKSKKHLPDRKVGVRPVD